MQRTTVFLDPDGTMPGDWLGVIVAQPTGVFYENQCAGTACEVKQQEGYYVPLSNFPMAPDEPRIGSKELSAAFHSRRGCLWGLHGEHLPPDRLAKLEAAVARIPFWSSHRDPLNGTRQPLQLDTTRMEALCEAWVPVLLPDGSPAILVWDNCD